MSSTSLNGAFGLGFCGFCVVEGSVVVELGVTIVIGSVEDGSGIVDVVVTSAEVVRLVNGFLVVVVLGARVELGTNFLVVGLILTVVSVVVLSVVVVVLCVVGLLVVVGLSVVVVVLLSVIKSNSKDSSEVVSILISVVEGIFLVAGFKSCCSNL